MPLSPNMTVLVINSCVFYCFSIFVDHTFVQLVKIAGLLFYVILFSKIFSAPYFISTLRYYIVPVEPELYLYTIALHFFPL
jgi:hypothetical protein